MSQAPEPKRRGRPPLPPGASTVEPVRTMRLSDAHWAELQARGGVAALRAWLDRKRRSQVAPAAAAPE